MAADLQPDNWIASWAVVSTDIVVPIASFTDGTTALSSADADGTTGDIREIMKSFLETILAAYAVEVGADTAPEQMTITKKSSVIADGKLSSVYTIKINDDILTSSVTDEPA